MHEPQKYLQRSAFAASHTVLGVWYVHQDSFNGTGILWSRLASVPAFPRRNYQKVDSYGCLWGNRIRKGLTVSEQTTEQSAGLVRALQYCVLSFYNVTQVTHSNRVFPLLSQYLLYIHMAYPLLLLGDPAGGQKDRNQYTPFIWANCLTAQCICFALVLHYSLLPVRSYFLSHPSSFIPLRGSYLLFL